MVDQACDSLRDQLYAFVDDALDMHMTLITRAHLEVCPICLQRYQFVLNMRHLLREAAATCVVPPRLEKRLRKLGHAGKRRTQRFRAVWQPALLVAAAALLVFVPARLFLRPAPHADLAPILLARHSTMLQEKAVPLRLRSSDPARVTTWIREQASYAVDLPRAALAGFTLVGATTFPLPERPGVYVLYKRGTQSMAYIALPGDGAFLPPGTVAFLGPQKLSLRQEGEYTIGFWQVHGQTYALIVQADEQEFLEYAALCL